MSGNVVLVFNMLAGTFLNINISGISSTVTIDWGDSQTSTVVSSGIYSHTYSSANQFTVTITGGLISFTINGESRVISCTSLSLSSLRSLFNTFMNCSNLTTIPSNISSSITNLSGTFFGCTKLNDSNILTWDTSNVTNMSSMFIQCSVFNQPLSFNTSSVTNMVGMFDQCSVFNQALSFNTIAVTNMSSMFNQCSVFNQALSFNTIAVRNMSNMFNRCSVFNQALSFNTIAVTNMSNMFYSCSAFNKPLSFTDTSKVTNMSGMFYQCYSLNQQLSFNTIAVTNMSYMFYSCSAFNQSLEFWNISNVSNMLIMLNYTALSMSNYSNTLISWNNLSTKVSSVTLSASNLKYNSAGQTARTSLISTYNWTINDAGLACVFEDTEISIDVNKKELVQNLKVGDNILTHKGIKKIKMIGYNELYIKNLNNFKVLPKSSFYENVPNKDLYISNGHSLLVTEYELTNYIVKYPDEMFYDNKQKIGEFYKLLSGDCSLCNCINENEINHLIQDDFIKYYHIVVESDDEHEQFIIYANDMMIETISKVWYKKSNLIDIE